MAVHKRGIQERIRWLTELGNAHSAAFCSPEATLARQRYLARHPTLVVVMKCMDGRVHIPVVTKTPLGIIQPLRNLGGMFDLGWPHLGEVLHSTVQQAVSKGRRVLLLITYHFSRGNPHRGCAGFDYDTEAAIRHTEAIKRQVEEIFGAGHQTVYPLVCGLETDEDALVLHNATDQRLDLSTLPSGDAAALPNELASLYPDMPQQILHDLLPLLEGNRVHIEEVRRTNRSLDIEHREWAICVGRGFDFLHVPNVALIVGPYSPNLDDPIGVAAGIIRHNMESGRIPQDGFLLLASSPYQEIGVDRARAKVKAQFLSAFAADVIGREYPDLAGRMVRRTAVLNWHTRALEYLDPANEAN